MNQDMVAIGPVAGWGVDLVPLPAPGPSAPAASSIKQVRK